MSTCTMALTDPDPGLDLGLWHRTRDQAALERLMAASLDQAYTQARRTLGNAADAQDAVQEAMVQIMRSAHRYDATRPFAPWLARHVHDACCRLRWRARRMKAREQAVARPDEVTPAEGVDSEAVRAAVAALPERDRAAVELHYWAGLPQAEVARELGMAENALAVRLHRARERLRAILARRGVVVGAASLAAALTPGQAWAAPTALVAGVHGLTTATVLPATTLPIGVVGSLAWAVQRHAWWTAAIAALVAALVGAGALLFSAAVPGPRPDPRVEVPPVPPVPPVPASADAAWTGPSREILRWLDPQAPVRMAFDLVAIRRSMLAAKPFSLFADPQAKPALDHLRAALIANKTIRTAVLLALTEGGQGLALSSGSAKHVVGALSLSASGMEVLGKQLREANTGLRSTPSDLGDPGWFTSTTDNAGCIGIHGRVLAIGMTESVRTLARKAAVEVLPEQTAPAWFRADLGPLIAAFAAADPDHRDPAGVGRLFGPGWRTLAPLVGMTVGVDAGVVVSELRLTRAVYSTPFNSPWGIHATFKKDESSNRRILSSAKAAMRAADPVRIAAAPAGALLWAAMGIQPAAWTDILAANADMIPQMPGLDRLLPLLSGDVCLIAEPGAPLPAVSLILGLSGRPDPAQITELASGFGLTTVEPGRGCRGAWQGSTPIGLTRVFLAEDRLVVSTSSDPRRFLVPATAVPEAPLVLQADLPRIMAAFGPMLLQRWRLSVGQDGILDPACLPPPQVLDRHLAAWHLTWTPTADGCVIRERGLPLIGVLSALATIHLMNSSNPAELSAMLRRDQDLLQAFQIHGQRLSAAIALGVNLCRGGPFTEADRQAMRPLFAGRLPTADEASGLGIRYADFGGEPEEMRSDATTPRYGGLVKRLDDGRPVVFLVLQTNRVSAPFALAGGILQWALPLGDGWSIGIIRMKLGGVVRGAVGLFNGDPPPADAPLQAEPRY